MRPWPFLPPSRPGRHRRRLLTGGSVAEGDGDVAMQLRLVRLHDEQGVALGVTHMATDLALGEDRIAGDDRTLQGQSLEQRQRRRNLVRLGRHDEVGPRLDRGSPPRARSHVRVESLEEVVIAGVAGRSPALDPEQPQCFRPQPATPAPDRSQIVRSRQHRSQGYPPTSARTADPAGHADPAHLRAHPTATASWPATSSRPPSESITSIPSPPHLCGSLNHPGPSPLSPFLSAPRLALLRDARSPRHGRIR